MAGPASRLAARALCRDGWIGWFDVVKPAPRLLAARPRTARARAIILCLLALEVAVSLQFAFGWGQAELMAATGLDDKVLHAAAFFVGTGLAALLWPARRVLLGVIVCAVAIELGQNMLPTREGHVDDALSSIAGGTLAVAMVWWRDRLLGRGK